MSAPSPFDANEVYTQFTVSKSIGERGYLMSTSVTWVQSRLITGALAEAVKADAVDERTAKWSGAYVKKWIQPLWVFVENNDKSCWVQLFGKELEEVSGCEVRVGRQYFSCDEY
jgi:hypothetical protein